MTRAADIRARVIALDANGGDAEEIGFYLGIPVARVERILDDHDAGAVMSGRNHHESAALRSAIDSSYELDEADRLALSPEHHQPHWDGLGEPNSWICTVCWGDGWQTSWPCEVAQKHGKEIAEAGGLRYAW